MCRRAGQSLWRSPRSRRCGRLFEPLVKPGPDLVGGQLCPLPLVTGDDDTSSRDAGDTGQTDNLPEVHEQEPLP